MDGLSSTGRMIVLHAAELFESALVENAGLPSDEAALLKREFSSQLSDFILSLKRAFPNILKDL